MDLSTLPEARKLDLLVAFADLEDWLGLSRALGDPLESFRLMDRLDRAVAPIVREAGGVVVKTMGDAWLLAYPAGLADGGIRSLLALKAGVEALLAAEGHRNRLRISAHVGEAVAGPFGAAGRLDIYGPTVNAAAAVGRGEHRGRLVVSPEAFRSLEPATRALFRRRTPAIVYLAEP